MNKAQKLDCWNCHGKGKIQKQWGGSESCCICRGTGQVDELSLFYKCHGILKNGLLAEEEFKEICKRRGLDWNAEASKLHHVTS